MFNSVAGTAKIQLAKEMVQTLDDHGIWVVLVKDCLDDFRLDFRFLETVPENQLAFVASTMQELTTLFKSSELVRAAIREPGSFDVQYAEEYG